MAKSNANVFTIRKEDIDQESEITPIPPLVTYKNRINDIGFNKLNLRESRLFMTTIAGMFEKGLLTQQFSFTQLKKIMHEDPDMSRNKFNELIMETSKKLASTCVMLRSDSGKWTIFTLFTSFTGDPETGILTVKTNPDFASLLNNISDNYTKFILEEYNSFESKYTQTLYRKIMQYKNIPSKECYITLADLKKLFEVKPDATVKHINQKILYPALKELRDKISTFKHIRLNEKKMKGQRPFNTYYFIWTKLK